MMFGMHSLLLRTEAFNLTNTVRFIATYDAAVVTEAASLGQYSRTLVPAGVLQFGPPYEF